MKIQVEMDPADQILRRRGLEAGGRAQQWLDNQVLALHSDYLPLVTGGLRRSGILGTVPGNGVVVYNAPQARFLYYGDGMVGARSRSAWAKRGERKVKNGVPLRYDRTFNARAGKLWNERMLFDHRRALTAGLAAQMGGRAT